MNSRHYKSKSLVFAKELRSNQTNCENIIWEHLRAKRLNGIKFRRQVPVGKYIADFVNLGKKLIIELDGSQHIENENYDKMRSEYLKEHGYTILRFFDNDVINNLDGVLNEIYNKYNELE